MKNRITIVLVLLSILLTSCTPGQPAGPTPTPTLEGEPVAPDEILIPPTTQVATPDLLDALESLAEDGTLTFDESVAGSDALQPGNVLVAEPSDAAPNGFLLKIVSVESQDGKVVVETTDALLTEAIHQGEASFEVELTEENIQSTQILVPGVQFVSHAGGGKGALAYAPLGLTYTFDTDFGTGGKLKMTGTATLNPILEASLGLSCNRKILGVCAEWPDLDFRTRLGVTESTRLEVHGNASTSFTKDLEIVRHNFTPITLFIGPVPVVFTPILRVYLHGDGTLSVKADYVVDQSLTLAAGFHYNSDTGFRDLSEKTSKFNSTDPVFEGNVSIQGYVGASFELLLYGLVGPYGKLEAGPQFKANYGGVATDADLLWRIEGCLTLTVGINSVKVLDLHYNKVLYRGCLSFGSAVAHPPAADIIAPVAGSSIFDGVPFTVSGQVASPDGIPVSCSWSSSSSSDPLPAGGCDIPITFKGAGSRSLTLTGTDAGGRTATDSIVINVQAYFPPTVTILSPKTSSLIYQGVPFTLKGNVLSSLGSVTCKWTSSVGADSVPSSGCEVSAKFNSTGSRTLILTGTDVQGRTGSASVAVNVQAPPAVNAYILSPADSTLLGPDTNITLQASADSGTGPYKFKWSIAHPTDVNGNGGTVYQIGNGESVNWTPSDTIPFDACVSDYGRLTLQVTDANGFTGTQSTMLEFLRLC